MRDSDEVGCGCTSLLVIIYIVSVIITHSSSVVETMNETQRRFLWIALGVLFVVSALIVYALNRESNNREKKIGELLNEISEEKIKRSNLQVKIKELESLVEDRDNLIKNAKPFSYVASLYADFIEAKYTRIESYLRFKKHPARPASEEVKKIKADLKEYARRNKQLEYEKEFILSTFPELLKYYDEDYYAVLSDDAVEISYDAVKDWISDEEYKKLSDVDRNQLALEKWKKKTKGKWIIGMLYEMYIAYKLRSDNRFYSVISFGIEHGYEDRGRDIIARKWNNDGTTKTYIIQCKMWSRKKELHENVICQLFGTSIEYQINTKNLFGMEVVVPLLVTTTELSDVAKLFAKKLGVEYRVVEIGDFPMIKCNVNNGNKIYHLPFDQQYWKTKIEHEGEFYAWTVKEAHDKGFRRAKKYLG